MRTELIADQPLVVVISDSSEIARKLSTELELKAVRVHSLLMKDVGVSQTILQEAYRVCLILKTEWFLTTTESERELLFEALKVVQKKTRILYPTILTFLQDRLGDIPYLETFSAGQRRLITAVNSSLPLSQWIFLQDVVGSSCTSTLDFVIQEIQAGLLYEPATEGTFVSLDKALELAGRLVVHPTRSNYLVTGVSRPYSTVIAEIYRQYQSLYFSPLSIRKISGRSQLSIPFDVLTETVREDFDQVLHRYITSIPGPRAQLFSFPWAKVLQEQQKSALQRQVQKPTASAHEDTDLIIPAELTHNHRTVDADMHPPDVMQPKQESVETHPTTPHALEKTQTPQEDNTAQKSTETPIDDKESKESFNLSQEVVRLFAHSHHSTKSSRQGVVVQERKRIIQKSKKRTVLFYAGLAFTGLGLGIVFLILIFSVSTYLFRRELSENITTLSHLVSSESAQAPQFSSLHSILRMQVDAYSALLSLPAIDDAQMMLDLADQTIVLSDTTTRSRATTSAFFEAYVSGTAAETRATIEEMSLLTSSKYQAIDSLNTQLKTSGDFLENPVLMEQFSNLLTLWRDELVVAQQLTASLAPMLGSEGQRTYALLFQNNQELRPTGGFVEAVAIITVSRNGLVGYQVFSPSYIQNRLPGSVRPPEEIRRFLGEEQLNFHDSNWDPHFPATAEQVTWFLEKGLNQDIDGIFTIDVDGLATLLKHLGPLDVPEYSEVLTHQNLAERVEFHSEVILVEDENKKDYRQLVFEKVLDRVKTAAPEKSEAIMLALRENFERQQMLVALERAEEMQPLLALGWTGGILTPQCPSQLSQVSCQLETIAQFEANVGVNKANYYLDRSIDHVALIRSESVYHERVITYTNNAQTNSWPKGPYKSYVRLYVPLGSQLEGVSINNLELPPEQLVLSEAQQKVIIGFFVEVPIRSSTEVVIRYSSPLTVSDKKRFSYALFEQYQPGSGVWQYRLRITPPATHSPTLIAPQPDIQGIDLLFDKEKRGHSIFGVQLVENN